MEPTTTASTHKAWISLLILVIFLAVVSFLLYRNSTAYKLKHIKNTVENVSTDKIDLTRTQGMARVPAAIPKDLPLETTNVSESYTMNYLDQNLTLSGYTYMTDKKPQDVYNLYVTYLLNNKYTFRLTPPENKQPGVLDINTMKDHDDLSVFISPNAGGSAVKIVFTDRK